MIATAGCGCAPAVVVRWLVVSALVLGAVALVVAARRRSRRGTEGTLPSAPERHAPSATESPGPGRRRARPELTAAILLVLAVVVGAASLNSDLSMLSLVVGAVIASVGMGATPSRHRAQTTTPTGESTAAGRPGRGSPV